MAKSSAESARTKFLEEFQKKFGTGSISVPDKTSYDVIPTGSLSLDEALASGGFIRGRITELWGPPSGGKTSLTLVAAGNAQRRYPKELVGFIDVEGTFDSDWATSLGVDISRMHLVVPATAEDVADITKEMMSSGLYSMIILDSIGAMSSKNEFEKDADEATFGVAKIITRMVKIAAVKARQYNVALLVINQVRANIGYGADTSTGGGWCLKHVTTHKLNLKRAGTAYKVGSGDSVQTVGFPLGVRVEKNKVGPEGRNVQFDFLTTSSSRGPIGIVAEQDIFKVAKRTGVLEQSGSWYTFPNGEKINSEAECVKYLKENPDVAGVVRERVLDRLTDHLVNDQPLSDEEIMALSVDK